MFDCYRRFVLAGAMSILILAVPGTGAADSLFGKRLALWGHDPVAYFTDNQAKMGSREFTAPFDDATYRFTTAEHRDMFIADPERYAPQYSGYCAGSLTRNRKVVADPNIWAILDGKLYVFDNAESLAAFRADTAAMVQRANANWPALRKAPLSGPPR